MLQKRRNHFDYILLETTGVADPLPIAKMFWLDEELHSDLILDGNLTEKKTVTNVTIISRFDYCHRWLQWIKSKTSID